jgi:hypothetical protein
MFILNSVNYSGVSKHHWYVVSQIEEVVNPVDPMVISCVFSVSFLLSLLIF